jgi:carboxyl-terminal processing protease
VLSYVENNYIEDADQDKLIYGAIKGMLATLDPHSSFLDPQQYREMKAETNGQFGGVGLEVEMRDGVLTVMATIEGTPAARAGITTGDQLLRIEDVATHGLTMDDAIARMRGKKGTPVRLLVGRKAWAEPRTVQLVRDDIKVENVTWRMLEAGYGYVRVRQFSENTERDLEAALDKLDHDSPAGANGNQVRGLVLDLRNNPGGLLDEAVRVADLFIENGLIVRTEGKGGRVIDEEKAHPRGTRLGFPIICLVNGGSASASEIVAGALQDHNRAVIMGTQTFGKGSVQTVIELDDGSALKLTIARYYTPHGRSIQENGITPDVVVEKLHLADLKPDHTDEPDKKERDLAGHLRNLQGAAARVASAGGPARGPNDDYQLQTALDYLKAWQIFSSRGTPGAPPNGTIQAGR